MTRKQMLYHSLLSTTVIHEASVVDSPWSIVRDRAEKAGILLAHELLQVWAPKKAENRNGCYRLYLSPKGNKWRILRVSGL